MNASLKFKFVGQNTFKLLMPIITNQNILRYIKYFNEIDPLSPTLADINTREVNLIADKTVVLTPFDTSVLTEEQIKIFFNPTKIDFGDGDDILNTVYYRIHIIVPTSKWVMNGSGQFLAYCISHEIAKEVDNKNIAGIGKVNIVGQADEGKVTDTFSGLTFKIAVNSANKA